MFTEYSAGSIRLSGRTPNAEVITSVSDRIRKYQAAEFVRQLDVPISSKGSALPRFFRTARLIVYAVSRQLSWTHIWQIIYLDDPPQREMYTQMCWIERLTLFLLASAATRDGGRQTWTVPCRRQGVDGTPTPTARTARNST